MALRVDLASLDDPCVRALLAAHEEHCGGASPPESNHFLALDGLRGPDVTLWGAFEGDILCGVGALKALDAHSGEIKSMHTASQMRGRGVGAAILRAILAEAERRGYRTLALETGSNAPFAAARALYERNGFLPCGPFGEYEADPYSAFYVKVMEAAA